MSIEDIFPLTPLSSGEEDVVIQAFTTPAVQRYLKRMATEDAKELLALSALSTEDKVLAKAHAVVQGKLQVIATLLSIEVIKTQPQNKE